MNPVSRRIITLLGNVFPRVFTAVESRPGGVTLRVARGDYSHVAVNALDGTSSYAVYVWSSSIAEPPRLVGALLGVYASDLRRMLGDLLRVEMAA